MSKNDFSPGFRFLKHDAVVLLLGAVGVAYFFKPFFVASFVIAMAVGHFFMFCNVFRLSRIPELIWAGGFLLLVAIHLRTGFIEISLVALLSILLSVTLIATELRKPSYHGIFWKQLNPDLLRWFDDQQKQATEKS